jgi:hypothetical protein
MVSKLQLPAEGNDPLPENGLVITVSSGLPVPQGVTFSAISATNGAIVVPTQPGTPIGVSGEANAGIGVQGISNASIGVRGQSTSFDAVVGETASDAHAGVTGRNMTTGANGGVGIYGVGGEFAGKFDGAVQINKGALNVTDDTLFHSIAGRLNVGSVVTSAGAGIGADLDVAGTVQVRGDVLLVGQDCAEDFDISLYTEPEPGTVMVLDDCGMLQESQQAYDKKVVGVISGGGEFMPGLILGRERASRNDRRAPVALVGKVYCKVDAGSSAIEVGDLLTTSTIKGHAMKALDATRAFGAVIGKALRSMPAGEKGVIPILVSLQ